MMFAHKIMVDPEALKAALNGTQPLALMDDTDCRSRWRKAPYVGALADTFDTTYDRIDTLFCDSTGFDTHGPALSMENVTQALLELQQEHGSPLLVALIDMGQFQVYMGVWKRKTQPVGVV